MTIRNKLRLVSNTILIGTLCLSASACLEPAADGVDSLPEGAEEAEDLAGVEQAVAATWNLRAGQARDVALSPSGIHWVIGNVPVAGGYSVHASTLGGTGYTFVSGRGAVRITLGRDGPWIVDANGTIFSRNEGLGAATGVWTQRPGCAKDIASNSDEVWIVGCDKVTGGYGIYRYNAINNTWSREPGGTSGTRIAIGSNGRPWIVNEFGLIFRRSTSGVWSQAPGNGRAQDIAVIRQGLTDVAYVVGAAPVPGGNGGVFFLNAGNAWEPVGSGSGTSIAASQSQVFVSNAAFQIFWTSR